MSNQDSSENPEGAPHEADLPGFGPSRRNKLDPIDPERTTVTSSSSTTPEPEPVYNPNQPLTAQVDVDELDDERLGLTDLRNLESSSRGSTEPDPVVANALEQLAKLGVTVASIALNRTIGKGNGAWVIHDEEAQAIATPLGRIGARHAPIGDGVAGDVADGIDAGLATAGYAMRAAADHQLASTVETDGRAGGDE